MYICAPYVSSCSRISEEGIGYNWNEVTDCCKLPCVCLKLNSGFFKSNIVFELLIQLYRPGYSFVCRHSFAFWDRGSLCSILWHQIHHVAQTDLKLLIFLRLSWNYGHTTAYPALLDSVTRLFSEFIKQNVFANPITK